MPRNPPWSRDELILAMELYVRHGWLDGRHPAVVELSRLLNRLARAAPTPTYRNPNGVSMKLANFRAIDPDHQGLGLRGAGRNDRAVWQEFTADRDRLTREALAIRIGLLDGDDEAQPAESPELADAEDLISELAGRRSSSQGFRVSADGRRALEAHAMALAETYYRERGWRVDNVSARASYDLRCTRPGSNALHVEVKGTQSDGRQILLTRHEVAHARVAFPNVALFIVACIQLYRDPDGAIAARAGETMVVEPWAITDSGLTPLAYVYRIPSGDVAGYGPPPNDLDAGTILVEVSGQLGARMPITHPRDVRECLRHQWGWRRHLKPTHRKPLRGFTASPHWPSASRFARFHCMSWPFISMVSVVSLTSLMKTSGRYFCTTPLHIRKTSKPRGSFWSRWPPARGGPLHLS